MLLGATLAIIAACGVVLSGSRQAAGAMVLGALLLLIYTRRAFVMAFFIGGSCAAGVVVAGLFFDLSALFNRFTDLEFIQEGLRVRINLWLTAFQTDDIRQVLFGRAYLYELFPFSEFHPHNIFGAFYRYSGLFPFVLLICAIVCTFYATMAAYKRSPPTELRDKRLVSSAIPDGLAWGIMMLTAMLYASVSGSVTRILHFYLIWGCCVGYIAAAARAEQSFRQQLQQSGRKW